MLGLTIMCSGCCWPLTHILDVDELTFELKNYLMVCMTCYILWYIISNQSPSHKMMPRRATFWKAIVYSLCNIYTTPCRPILLQSKHHHVLPPCDTTFHMLPPRATPWNTPLRHANSFRINPHLRWTGAMPMGPTGGLQAVWPMSKMFSKSFHMLPPYAT